MLLAKVQQAAGRKEHAAERYRQFIAIAPDAPERNEAEAALADAARDRDAAEKALAQLSG